MNKHPTTALPARFFRQYRAAACGLILGFSLIAPVRSADFPPVKLRGYGTLSGQVATGTAADGSSTSLLTITCDDEEKAKLVQAKYLSDLQVLPGVQPKTVRGREGVIPAYEVEGEGAITAARVGAKVYILTARSADALGKAESGGAIGGHERPVFKPETDVPMYLDRWDKYGFRFYMWPWMTPEGDHNYDLIQEYDYAAKEGCGMQFWADTCKVNTAEGLMNDVYWLWGAQAARQRRVPLGINTNAGFEAPVWLLNRYRDQAAEKMPGYVGCFYDTGVYNLGGPGWLSWAATTGLETLLSVLQETVRSMKAYPNVTSFMEPHCETQHGVPDVMLEYGPTADASYRGRLRRKYTSIGKLNAAWQTTFSSWNAVRVPELVSFLGYGPQAIDLTGLWHIGYEPAADGRSHPLKELTVLARQNPTSAEAPADWFAEKFDDSKWPVLTAPGDDAQTLLPRWPAVFRRAFQVPAGWTVTHPKVWVYIWDLNRGTNKDFVKAALNGQMIGTSQLQGGGVNHLAIFPAGTALRDGSNVIAIRTPQGRINYKVYLSPDEPRKYPNLGDAKNQQWADLIDWDLWLRGDAIGTGMEMIRQIEPDKGIMLASPYTYADQIKEDAKKYGGDFHDTGGMAGWWNDMLSSWMRGAGLPTSAEPGNPAHNVSDFRMFFGNWLTEGVNAVDYFINIGDVMWDPEIKAYFEENLKIMTMFGKYHAPFADVAEIYSSFMPKLMEFPWNGDGFVSDPNPFLDAAYTSGFNARDMLRRTYESDAVMESSFANGDAAKYKVVIDSDTSVMDETTIDGIEKYVRDGGVFVTFGQTGRHLPGRKDAWPIQRLTGYKVTASHQRQPAKLEVAGGQKIIAPDWTDKPQGDGATLEKVAPDAVDLLDWSNGGVAAGMRQLGKGYIIDLGCWSSRENDVQLFTRIFKWRNLAPIPARIEPADAKAIFRHFVSNNGLYDVWMLWNRDKATPLSAGIVLADSLNPQWALCVKDGSRLAVANHRLDITIKPYETAVYLTPRADITAAPAEWLTLQRNWWQGAARPLLKPLPPPLHKRSVDLNADWAFMPLSGTNSAAGLAEPDFDDSAWQKTPMGIWNFTPGRLDVRHAILRKRFTVPAAWTKGEPTFWLRSWDGETFHDSAQIYIDGRALFPAASGNGAEGINPGGALKPGTTHTVAVEISGTHSLNGSAGNAWLWYWPDPVSSIDLAGKWDSSPDGLTYRGALVPIPGPFVDNLIRTRVAISASHRNQRAVIELETLGAIHNILVNGHLVARHHHNIGKHWELDVTPWINFGGDNQIEIAADGDGRIIQSAKIGFFEPGSL